MLSQKLTFGGADCPEISDFNKSTSDKARSVRSINEGKVYPYSFDDGQVIIDKFWLSHFSYEAAAFLSKLHWWLNQEKSGFLYKGYKWIAETYQQLGYQLNISRYNSQNELVPDVDRIGRMIRCLEQMGVIITTQDGNPCTKTYRQKFYRIDYWKLYELTGLNPNNFPFDQVTDIGTDEQESELTNPEQKVPQIVHQFTQFVKQSAQNLNQTLQGLKPAWLSNLHFCSIQSANLHHSTCTCCMTYNTLQYNFNIFSKRENEPTQKILNLANCTESGKVPQISQNAQNAQNAQNTEFSQSHTVEVDRGEFSGKSPTRENSRPKLKTTSREKHEWEVEVGKPYPYFVQWRATTHYKPQGGHWESGAESHAVSEILRKSDEKPEAARIMWESFLEYTKRSTDNVAAAVDNGIQTQLPSCFQEREQLDPVTVAADLETVQQKLEVQKEERAALLVAANQGKAAALLEAAKSVVTPVEVKSDKPATAPDECTENFDAYKPANPGKLSELTVEEKSDNLIRIKNLVADLANKVEMPKAGRVRSENPVERINALLSDPSPAIRQIGVKEAFKNHLLEVIFDDNGQPCAVQYGGGG